MKKIFKCVVALGAMALAYKVGRDYNEKVETTATDFKDGALDLADKVSSAAKNAWKSVTTNKSEVSSQA